MRNLKRALSLTLASIMLLGMMVVGSSAASYQDVTDEHNVEAIEVLQAVGIMVGDEGNFNPEKNVTRNEMAVIMSNLMDYRVATYSGTSPFTDVPSWAEPYVAACYTNGITSGTSATTYNGSGNVTTAQAALMVMKALGYFQTADDFKGDWQLATTRQANSIDLLVGVKAGVREAMTRNDVAQLVLNGLESGIVEVDNNNSVSVSVGEAQVNINGNKYVFVTSGQDYAHAIDRKLATANDGQYSNGFIVELGEKLYQGALTKESAEGYRDRYGNFEDGNVDDFGRPADHWEYQGKEIGTYVIDPSVDAFTKKVTTKALYNAVGAAACNYEWHVEVDGFEMNNTAYGKTVSANKTEDNDCFLETCGKPVDENNKDTLSTGNGTLTQVYVDGTNRIVHVSVIHYYAAEVLRVNNADSKDRSITLSNLDSSGKADTNDVFETEDFTEDDVVAYSFAGGSIQEVYATEKLEGKVTQARAREEENNNIKNGDHFTVDETKYEYNTTVPGASPRRLTTENVNNNMVGYLDQLGYVIYIDDAAATYDYAYVLTMGSRNDDYGPLEGATRAGADGKTWYARLVLTDGTVVKAETDAKDNSLLHHLVSYSVDSKGVYSLIDRSTDSKKNPTGKIGEGGVNIDTGAAGVRINGSTYTANNDTVFIIADSDKESADDFNFRVYTGIKNVPDIENWKVGDTKTLSVAAEGTNGVAKVIYIQDGDVSGTKNVIFIKANKEAKFDKVTGSSRCYIIDAVEDGEVVTLRVKEGSEADKKLVNHIEDYTKGIAVISADKNGKVVSGILAAEYLTRDADGVVTNVKLYDKAYDPTGGQDEGYDVQTGTQRAERGTVGMGASTRYGYGDNTIVVRYDVPSGDFYFEKNLNGIKDDADDEVIGVIDTGSLTGICYLNTTKSGAGEKPSGGDKPGTYSVTVNGEVVVANVAETATGTYEYTVETGKVATYNGKNYAAGEKIALAYSKDNHTFVITVRDEGVGVLTTTLVGDIEYKTVKNGANTVVQATLKSWPTWVPDGATIKGKIVGQILGVTVATSADLTFTKTNMTSSVQLANFDATADGASIAENKPATPTYTYYSTTAVNTITSTTGEQTTHDIFVPNAVKVEYANASSTIDLVKSLSTKPAHLLNSAAYTASANVLAITFNTTDSSTDVYAGVKAGDGVANAVAEATAKANATLSTNAITPDASLKKAVTITLRAANELVEAYTIKADSTKTKLNNLFGTGALLTGLGVSNGGTDTVKLIPNVAAAANTGVAAGTKITISADLPTKNTVTGDVVGYKVVATIDGVEYTAYTDGGSNKGNLKDASGKDKVFEITSNMTVTDVVVAPVAAVKLTSATWDVNTITVTFNQAISKAALTGTVEWDKITVANASKVDVDLSEDGKTLTIVVDAVATSGSATTVKFAANCIVSAEWAANKMPAADLTLTAAATKVPDAGYTALDKNSTSGAINAAG